MHDFYIYFLDFGHVKNCPRKNMVSIGIYDKDNFVHDGLKIDKDFFTRQNRK